MANYRLRVGYDPEALPSWVPAAGHVNTVTPTNKFTAITAGNYANFYSWYGINGDCGGVLNPYWGTFGAMMFFGEGHSSGNDNSVRILELGSSDMTFKRLSTPAPLFGTGTDATTQARNSGYDEPTYSADISDTSAEYVISGHTPIEPAAPHSYGALDIIPPANGGGACGTLLVSVIAAPGHKGQTQSGYGGAYCTYEMPFANSIGATGSYTWDKIAVTGAFSNTAMGGPAWEQYVPAQDRVYIEMRDGTVTRSPRWFNRATNAYVQGTGTARANNGDSDYTGTMFDVPERNLVIFADKFSNNLRIQYLDVSSSDPSWATASISPSIAVGTGFSALEWCADNSRLIALAESSAVQEIEIPVSLGGTWASTRQAFLSGSITLPNSNGSAEGSPSYKKWSYNPLTKSFVFFPAAQRSDGGTDVVYVYRPVGV